MTPFSEMPTGDGPQGAAAAAPQPARRISSDSVPIGGFTPGTILADRYRIIGLLGRGGMGEVYRADDLKLGQAVALKFLPKALASDPVRRERFFAEVRITRQLAHPNICRVYDIAEFDGQHFLSMEYIDGEDLASLIKRIGYLPNEKALEIARQLAAGLAAAHDRGVLHRDLKPANIMIDGHGRVRITDFGLAVAIDDEKQTSEIFGTPAYMAPEQFAGKGASVRTDIYALGLILFEVFCGKFAFKGASLAELRAEKERPTPTGPSEIRAGVDPVVERLIMRSIDPDPHQRPTSAMQFAAALPGGDPLAAALAAGETPSPEMVAAVGANDGMRPIIALALVLVVFAGWILMMAGSSGLLLVRRAPLNKPPDVLIERARELIAKAGYPSPPVDDAFGFDYDSDMMAYIPKTDATPNRWKRLETLSPVFFWYRQSQRPIEHPPMRSGLGNAPMEPPLQFSGDILVFLDGEGHLRKFQAIPPQHEPSATAASAPDWSALTAAAGFNQSSLSPVAPQWVPFYFADARTAFQGSLPNAPDIPVRIEAAAFGGQLVDFEIIGPWTNAVRMSPVPIGTGEKVTYAALIVILAVLIVGGGLFARRNLRMGRGDRRGAAKVATLNFSLFTIGWILTEHHVAAIGEVSRFVFGCLGAGLFFAAMMWILYVALEPFVRRRWPHILISWTRLLGGGFRDPLVGRHILIGCAAGAAWIWLARLGDSLAPLWFGYPEKDPAIAGSLVSLVHPTAILASYVPQWVLGDTIALLFLVVLLRVFLRNEKLVIVAASLFEIIVATTNSSAPFLTVPFAVAALILTLVILIRFGLLSAMFILFAQNISLNFPMTFNTSAWYFHIGMEALVVYFAITVYAAWTAIGNQPLLELANTEA